MKQWGIKILIVLTITGVTTGYYFKTRSQQTILDQYIKSLHGLKDILPSNSRISLYTDSFNYDLLIRCRYTLAPVIVNRGDEHNNDDTSLYVIPISNNDTNLLNQIHHQSKIWERSDSQYHYYLVAGH